MVKTTSQNFWVVYTATILILGFITATNGDKFVTSNFANRPTAVRYSAGLSINNGTDFVVYGGQTNTNKYNVYKFATDTWTAPTSPLPTLLGSCYASTPNKSIYWFFGGNDGTARTYNLMQFDVSAQTYTMLNAGGSPPSIRTLCALGYYNNKLYMYGGGQGITVNTDDFYTYDLVAQTGWVARYDLMPPGATARLAAAYAQTTTGLWFIYGGLQGTTTNNELLTFAMNNETWLPVRTVPRSMYDGCMAIDETAGILYMYGGSQYSGPTYYYMGKYNYKNSTWLDVQTPLGTPFYNMSGCTMGLNDNRTMILIQGFDDPAGVYYLSNEWATPTSSTAATSNTGSNGNTNGQVGSTADNSQATNNKSDNNNNTIIIAVVVSVGGVVLISLIAAVVIVTISRRRKRARGSEEIDGVPMERSDRSGSHSGNNSRGNTSYGNNSRGNTNTSRGNIGGSNPSDSNYAPIRVGDHSTSHKGLGNSWEIPWEELEIDEELGRGAYGVVYKARWRNQLVAVKRVIGDFSQIQMEDFLAEAELMSKLRPHENMIQFLGVVTNPLAIITKFYESGSLSALLESGETLSTQTTVELLKGIVAGVMHLHMEKIVHRDLACRNVLVSGSGSSLRAVVSDFGFARSLNGTETGLTNSTIGPIRWMAPESLTEQQYSPKSDLFSFGVVVWEIITRERPWKQLDEVNTILAVTSGKRLPIPEDAHPILQSIMADCWRANPEERPSFKEIYRRLEELQNQTL